MNFKWCVEMTKALFWNTIILLFHTWIYKNIETNTDSEMKWRVMGKLRGGSQLGICTLPFFNLYVVNSLLPYK